MRDYPSEMMHSTGVSMVLDDHRLLLGLKEPRDREEVERVVSGIGVALERDVDGLPGERVNHTTQRYWLQSDQSIDDERYRVIEQSVEKLDVAWTGPVYQLPTLPNRQGLIAPLPNVLLLNLRKQEQGDNDGVHLITAILAEIAHDATPVVQEDRERSRYLIGFRYFVIKNPRELNAYQVRQRLMDSGNEAVLDVQFESMPLLSPAAIAPNDPLFAQQWSMARIQAGGPGRTGWDISTGAATVVACVHDSGCDLQHPDLRFSTPGINLGTMTPDGSPVGTPGDLPHGTACAGILAATYNNAVGVSGVAGNCRIMPLANPNWTDAEVANGITWATANGAHVISMSFGNNGWNRAVIDPAIQNAFNNNLVMCACTHNQNAGPSPSSATGITYPATNPLVMAVGASDQVDNRKTPTSPDNEGWGSNFGPEISVVAPGVRIPTTDQRGAAGYDPSGDYFMTFRGTSAATPHVAGLVALIRSAYPTLSNVQVRALIERTADKVGASPYVNDPSHPNGTWNQEMGYGRINALRALDAADVMIKDAANDTGVEPFNGGNFWDFSDIVVRINDDGVFVPSDPVQSKNVERGQSNFVYVRVTNTGPRAARNVTVDVRIAPFVGLQFMYPQDWTSIDKTHVRPVPVVATFASVPAGGAVTAKFRVEAAQTEALYGWGSLNGWHPCLLAVVDADNDYAFGTASIAGEPMVAARNNLAQRNLSVIDVVANQVRLFPFVVGNAFSEERFVSLTIDRSRLPEDMPLRLALDDGDGEAFPLLSFDQDLGDQGPSGDGGVSPVGDGGMVFLERTRVKVRLGSWNGVLTLQQGSRFDSQHPRRIGNVSVRGGEVILREGRRYVEVDEPVVVVEMEKAPNQIYPLSIQAAIPGSSEEGQEFLIQVSQQGGTGTTVGGAAVIYRVRATR